MISDRTLFVVSIFLLLSSFRQNDFNYTFRISTNQTVDSLPENLRVEIINNENSTISLTNLVFNFDVDGEGYWATCDKTRFLEEALTLRSKTDFKQTISIDSLTFMSFNGYKPTPVNEMKTKLKNSTTVRIEASISDMRRLHNKRSSSSLTHSNTIVLHVK
jgi:hypothetical protein